MKNIHGHVSFTQIQNLVDHVTRSLSHGVDPQKIRDAIERDMAQNGFVITKQQINILMMGLDGGEVPEKLKICFGELNHCLLCAEIERGR